MDFELKNMAVILDFVLANGFFPLINSHPNEYNYVPSCRSFYANYIITWKAQLYVSTVMEDRKIAVKRFFVKRNLY